VSVDRLLAEARSGLVRLKPHAAADAVRAGGLLVDTRPEYQRRADGDIPGALVVERNHLEWRLDRSFSVCRGGFLVTGTSRTVVGALVACVRPVVRWRASSAWSGLVGAGSLTPWET
jgi:hypothetical protein